MSSAGFPSFAAARGSAKPFEPMRSTATALLDRAAVSLLRRIEPDPELAETRRTKLWELPAYLHCSIVGPCLSTAQLHDILAKSVVVGTPPVSEHDLHIVIVRAAG